MKNKKIVALISCAALLIGAVGATLAWLMDEKTENVYQRRLRLRKNINSSAPLNKDLFLLMLGK